MITRTLRFEHDSVRGWRWEYCDAHDVVLLISIKWYETIGEALADIRDLLDFVDDL